MNIRGILFDKDGTLLDFHRTWVPTLQAAALVAAGGEEALSERLLALGGYEAQAGRVRAESPLAVCNAAEIAGLWSEHLSDWSAVALTPVLEGVFLEAGRANAAPVAALRPFFAGLKDRGLMLGVASADSQRGVEQSLGAFGILEFLDFVAGYDTGYGSKPDPGMAQAFCARTAIAPAELAVVGDNQHDLEMGRRAGAALLVGVLTGTGGHADLAPLADHVLDDITGLGGLLDRLS